MRGYIFVVVRLYCVWGSWYCWEKQNKVKLVFCETYILTETTSSGSCMVMQSILIWIVFPADLSVGLSVKLSSMGWTEWMVDLKQHGQHWKVVDRHFFKVNVCFFCSIHLLVQHIEQLVEHILAEQVRCLCWLILGHGGKEWAFSPGQAGGRVPESEKKHHPSATIISGHIYSKKSSTYFTAGIFFLKKGKNTFKSSLKVALSANIWAKGWCAELRFGHPASGSEEGGVLLAAIHEEHFHCEEVSLHNTEYLYYT